MSSEKLHYRLRSSLKTELSINRVFVIIGLLMMAFIFLFFWESSTLVIKFFSLCIQPFALVILLIYLQRLLFIKSQLKRQDLNLDEIQKYGISCAKFRNPSTLILLIGILLIVMAFIFEKNVYMIAVGSALTFSSGILLVGNLASEFLIKTGLGEEPH